MLHKNQLLMVAVCATGTLGFAPVTPRQPTTTTTTALQLGIPKFFLPKEESKSEATGEATKDEKKLDMKGLLQLITAGAGAPFLGDYEGVDEETGKFMFSLEANVSTVQWSTGQSSFAHVCTSLYSSNLCPDHFTFLSLP